ncbi:MAG TPA: hypothetical protein VM408_02455 [Methylomirabilota bacterium]|nr:hypothetical protein [Methylomirabilota bacterium]
MSRVPRTRLIALAVMVGLAALTIGACQAAPARPDLTDPKAILAAAVTSTAAARTVRVDATADGTVSLDLLGMGTPSPIQLDGTTASADLDLANGDARTTFSAPGLLGLTGELIALDGTSYLKSTLTGALYRVQPIGTDVPAPSGQARDTVLKGLTDLLGDQRLTPVKGDDTPCGSTTCYRVDIALSPEDLAALGLGELQVPGGLPVPIQLPDLTAASIDLNVLVAKDTTRLTGVKMTADLGGGAGVATLDVSFSKWDEPVTITAPPADQLAQ